MDTMRAIDHAQIEFLKKIGYFNSSGHIREPKLKLNKSHYVGNIIYNFDFNGFSHSLWDGRNAGYQNFKLTIVPPNHKKKIQILGIDKIIDYLNKSNIPKKYVLQIEKLLMERII